MSRPEKRERLTEAQRQLAATEVALALRMARKASRSFPSLREEFTSNVLLALCEAARTFDPSRGTFRHHAIFRIRGSIRDTLRQHVPFGYRRRRRRGLREEHIPAVTSLAGMPDFLLTDHDSFVSTEAVDLMQTVLKGLSARDQTIISKGFAGMQQSVIASMTGLTRAGVAWVQKQTIARLRERFQSREGGGP